jgi:tripartite-type tricarboxylate transporter receptor subunit TctC
MIRKSIGALALLAVLAGAAAAQEYPNRPIKFLHGFPPGGNVDIIARLWATRCRKGSASRSSSRPSPGVAGSLAAETVARSDPDGYTLLVVPSAHPAHGALSKKVNYKVVDDFEWISVASFYPFLICVRKDSRFQSLKQLIEEARKNPGGLSYGSAGVGSILHTTVELLANDTKTKFLHVPYRGEAPAITGLLQGEIDFIAATSGPISPRIRSGEFRALAVTGKTRWRDFPRRADGGGGRHSRIRSHLLDWPRRSRETAATHRRQAQRRGAPRDCRSRGQEQARGYGRRSTRDHAGRDARAGGEPDGDVGQARQGRPTSRSIRQRPTADALGAGESRKRISFALSVPDEDDCEEDDKPRSWDGGRRIKPYATI